MTVYCTRCGAAVEDAGRFCGVCGNAMVPGAEAVAVPAPALPVVVASGPRYAGFWIRFVAVLIDGLLVSLVTTPVSFAIGMMIAGAGLAVSMPEAGIQIVSFIAGATLGMLANWLYEALMISSVRQATVGKMAFRLRVTDLQGNRLSFARASGRYFAKWISNFTLLIGYILAAFTERHQALHDMIAGTLVCQD